MNLITHLIRQIAGWLLIAIGVVGIFIPVMPQLPFLAAGVLLLAPYIRIFRRLSAWLHRKYPRLRGPLRPFRVFKRRAAAPGAEFDLAPRRTEAHRSPRENGKGEKA
jgi:hypothetical protein